MTSTPRPIDPQSGSSAVENEPIAPAGLTRPSLQSPSQGSSDVREAENVTRGSEPAEESSGAPPTVDPQEKLRRLYHEAATKFEGVQDYLARFRRREVVNGKQQPEEIMLVRFRKEPFSIYMRWLEGSGHEGREVIFVKGQYDNKLQTKTGKGDGIGVPGMRLSVDPLGAQATASSRRTILEAGMGKMVERFGAVLASQEDGTKRFGTLHPAGPHQRPEFSHPLECVVQKIPPGSDRLLPRGGARYWFFNAEANAVEFGLPVLVVTLDDTEREVEYYHHERLNFNVGLRDQDFDPDVVWSKRTRGLVPSPVPSP